MTVGESPVVTDDPAIIAGQGTVGLEILEQVPDIDAIIVAVGGGGLVSGVLTAVKSKRPGVQVIGVEPEVLPSMRIAMCCTRGFGGMRATGARGDEDSAMG